MDKNNQTTRRIKVITPIRYVVYTQQFTQEGGQNFLDTVHDDLSDAEDRFDDVFELLDAGDQVVLAKLPRGIPNRHYIRRLTKGTTHATDSTKRKRRTA